MITKELDKATPLLLNSLTNASIASRVEHGMQEQIGFAYQKITWTWIDGGVSAEDDWEAPVAWD